MGLLEGCFGLLTNYLFLWVCLRDVSDSLLIIHSFILWILRRQLFFLFKFYYMAVIATFFLLLCDQAIINYLIEQFDAFHLLHEYNFCCTTSWRFSYHMEGNPMGSCCFHMDLFPKKEPTLMILLSCHYYLENLTNVTKRSWKLWRSVVYLREYLLLDGFIHL